MEACLPLTTYPEFEVFKQAIVNEKSSSRKSQISRSVLYILLFIEVIRISIRLI